MVKVDKVFVAIISASLIIGGAIYVTKPDFIIKAPGKVGAPESGVKASLGCYAPENTVVTKIIDGDTIIVEGGYHVRLLGIDADEENDACYDSAKKRLEQILFGKKIILEKDVKDVDRYDRCLRYVFFEKENVNIKMVKDGQVVASSYPPDVRYSKEIAEAEKSAIQNKVGCKWDN
ncbi:MAG: thermonuclease family protein [Candidatus Staskawiczbacteria bacterium]|nr:thermonuclease family protein [Candidatus Staskawiczbacteria bacterium]